MASLNDNQRFKYYAFISYSRKDERWAKWLHQRLENYKLPSLLVKESGGILPKQISPVFLDKTDIGIGGLQLNLELELEDSRFLIVVCSPNSADSGWVNKEVAKFKELGRENRIIPFIIEGSPDPKGEEKQCYPEALDKNTLGASLSELPKEQVFIKIVASMLGLKFDELWQRQKRRERKRKNMNYVLMLIILLSIFTTSVIIIDYRRKSAQKILESESKILSNIAYLYIKDNRDITKAFRYAQYAYLKDTNNIDAKIAFFSTIFINKAQPEPLFYRYSLKHNGPIWSAVFNIDGDKILTSSMDSTAKIWNVATGKELTTLSEKTNSLRSAFYSKDCSNILTVSSFVNPIQWESISLDSVNPVKTKENRDYPHPNVIRLWNTINGKETHRISDPINMILFAYISPDNTKIVTLCSDSSCVLWDVRTGSKIRAISNRKKHIYSAAFSADGNYILTATDSTSRLWNVNSGAEIMKFANHNNKVYSAIFSPDGKSVLSVSGDSVGKVSDVTTGKELYTLTGFTLFMNPPIFSPDGKWIVSTSNDNIPKIWEVATGKLVNSLNGHTNGVYSAIFSQDCKNVLTASADGSSIIWDANTGKELAILSGHTDQVFSAVYSPDGKEILTASKDSTAKIWKARTEIEPASLLDASDIKSAVFSPDGKRVLTTSVRKWTINSSNKDTRGNPELQMYLSNDIIIWDAESGKQLTTLPGQKGCINSALFTQDGQKIFTTSDDKTVKIWNSRTGLELSSWSGIGFDYAVVSNDGNLIANIITNHNNDTAKIWNANAGKLLFSIFGTYIDHITFSPNGEKIFLGFDDTTTKLLESNNGKELLTFHAPTDNILSVVFSPNGKKILLTFDDETAKIWDTETGNKIAILANVGNFSQGTYNRLPCFSPDGTTVLFPSPDIYDAIERGRNVDLAAKIYDASTGKLITKLVTDENEINLVAYSPDGKLILTECEDNSVKIWDAQSGRELASLNGHIKSVISAAFSPDGKKILTASQDGTAKIWNISIPDIIKEMDGKIEDLSPEEKVKYDIK